MPQHSIQFFQSRVSPKPVLSFSFSNLLKVGAELRVSKPILTLCNSYVDGRKRLCCRLGYSWPLELLQPGGRRSPILTSPCINLFLQYLLGYLGSTSPSLPCLAALAAHLQPASSPIWKTGTFLLILLPFSDSITHARQRVH